MRTRFRFAGRGAGILAALLLGSAAPAAFAEDPSVDAPPPAEASASEEDAVLAERIDARLRRDAFVERYEIEVEVEDGVAHLRGAVAADHERERAIELAESVEGVKSVDDEDLLVGKTSGAREALPPLTPGSGGGISAP